MLTDKEKIEIRLAHIERVTDNTKTLGLKLIAKGEFSLGKKLIVNGLKHDLSKFEGIEWDHLDADNTEPHLLRLAVEHHNRTNKHHPEYWQNIHLMPRLYLSECCCDWKARSNEFNDSLVNWIENEAMKRFGFTKSDKVYSEIMEFVGMLSEKPFKPLPKV